MGKYKLLYPLNEKMKENFKKNNMKNSEEKEGEKEPEKKVSVERNENKSTKSKRKSSEHKVSITKKKTMKEEEIDDGDIYLKYLKKASMLWEDFTTGKKKIKEESSDALPKKQKPKNKLLNANKTVREQSKTQKKPIEK